MPTPTKPRALKKGVKSPAKTTSKAVSSEPKAKPIAIPPTSDPTPELSPNLKKGLKSDKAALDLLEQYGEPRFAVINGRLLTISKFANDYLQASASHSSNREKLLRLGCKQIEDRGLIQEFVTQLGVSSNGLEGAFDKSGSIWTYSPRSLIVLALSSNGKVGKNIRKLEGLPDKPPRGTSYIDQALALSEGKPEPASDPKPDSIAPASTPSPTFDTGGVYAGVLVNKATGNTAISVFVPATSKTLLYRSLLLFHPLTADASAIQYAWRMTRSKRIYTSNADLVESWKQKDFSNPALSPLAAIDADVELIAAPNGENWIAGKLAQLAQQDGYTSGVWIVEFGDHPDGFNLSPALDQNQQPQTAESFAIEHTLGRLLTAKQQHTDRITQLTQQIETLQTEVKQEQEHLDKLTQDLESMQISATHNP